MIPSLCRLASNRLPPLIYHYLPTPITYSRALLLQETILSRRIAARHALATANSPSSIISTTSPSLFESHSATTLDALELTAATDVLLLLQHQPVYTAGRRMKDLKSTVEEGERLVRESGAEYEVCLRGGETTFHGIGQMVGYCSMDLARAGLTTRNYVERLQSFLTALFTSHRLPLYASPHTGIFTSPTTKLGSIGIHVLHRLTLHGFAFNVSDEPLPYFDRVVACGLTEVKATSIVSELRQLGREGEIATVEDMIESTAREFGTQFDREMKELNSAGAEYDELKEIIRRGIEGQLEPLVKAEI